MIVFTRRDRRDDCSSKPPLVVETGFDFSGQRQFTQIIQIIDEEECSPDSASTESVYELLKIAQDELPLAISPHALEGYLRELGYRRRVCRAIEEAFPNDGRHELRRT